VHLHPFPSFSLRAPIGSSFVFGAFADETAKWEKITYVGIVSCTLFAAYNLSKGHPHFDEPPVRSESRFVRTGIRYWWNLMHCSSVPV
jgi:hypothetical protein